MKNNLNQEELYRKVQLLYLDIIGTGEYSARSLTVEVRRPKQVVKNKSLLLMGIYDNVKEKGKRMKSVFLDGFIADRETGKIEYYEDNSYGVKDSNFAKN